MNERKLSRVAPVCDRDCFNCPHPDCILENLTAEDYAAARALEGYIHPPTPAEIRIAAKKKAYREENREAIAAKKKAYYEENREAIAAKKGRALYDFRTEHGMTQTKLGRLVGVSQPTISLWETGAVPFDLDAVLAKAGCCG